MPFTVVHLRIHNIQIMHNEYSTNRKKTSFSYFVCIVYIYGKVAHCHPYSNTLFCNSYTTHCSLKTLKLN